MTEKKKSPAKKQEEKNAKPAAKKTAKVVKKKAVKVLPRPTVKQSEKPVVNKVVNSAAKKKVKNAKPAIEKKVLDAVSILDMPNEFLTPEVKEGSTIVEGVDYDSLTPSHELEHHLKVVKDHVLARLHFSGDANNSERSGTEPDEIVRLIKTNYNYTESVVNMYDKGDEVMFELIKGAEIAQVSIRKSVYGCSGVLF